MVTLTQNERRIIQQATEFYDTLCKENHLSTAVYKLATDMFLEHCYRNVIASRSGRPHVSVIVYAFCRTLEHQLAVLPTLPDGAIGEARRM